MILAVHRLGAPERVAGPCEREFLISADSHVNTDPSGTLPSASASGDSAAIPTSRGHSRLLEVPESRSRKDGANAQTKSTPSVASSPHENGVEDSADGGNISLCVVDRQEGPGLRKVREFILKLKPKDPEGPSGPSWQDLQLEPTPTLLPDLRYVLCI